MSGTPPQDEICLSPEERREVEVAWHAMQTRLQPIGEMIEHADKVECNELHAAFLQLAAAFDAFEHAIMRAQQIRLLHAAPRGEATG